MARPQKFSDEEILGAARELVLEHGTSVATAKIAEHVGLSAAALFKRFGSKEHLLVRALVADGKPPWFDLVEDGPDDRPIPEQLVELGVEMTRFFEMVVPCTSLLHASGIDPHELMKSHEVPPPVVGLRAITGWVRRAQKRGLMRDLDAQSFTVAFIGGLQGRVFMKHIAGAVLEPDDDAETFIHKHVALLWDGARPAPKEG